MTLVWLLLVVSLLVIGSLVAHLELKDELRRVKLERDKYKFQTDQLEERCYKGKGKDEP